MRLKPGWVISSFLSIINYQTFEGDNMPEGDSMVLVDQESVYNQCGLKIKSDLLGICKEI